ncbi:hypothetical protein [Falsiroseomonas sp. E2-1-a20]|uniref:hypothetical protein n=1 Tax=Falsiroseomonas sp. E2-1-a20 TaxID=3239300 RepID=UPI003F4059FA
MFAPSSTIIWRLSDTDTMPGKALARAFRWRQMMETKRYGTINELAATEKINSSYVSRLLRLTLLAPDIVEAILERGSRGDDPAGADGAVSGGVGRATSYHTARPSLPRIIQLALFA